MDSSFYDYFIVIDDFPFIINEKKKAQGMEFITIVYQIILTKNRRLPHEIKAGASELSRLAIESEVELKNKRKSDKFNVKSFTLVINY